MSFGIQVGVSINILLKRRSSRGRPKIFYFRTGEDWHRDEKLQFLQSRPRSSSIEWQLLAPNSQHTWLTQEMSAGFASLVPLGTKGKRARGKADTVFQAYSLGVTTNRDPWTYNADRETLLSNVRRTIEVYNDHVARWPLAQRRGEALDDWVEERGSKIAWSEGLKNRLRRGLVAELAQDAVRPVLFRPYTKLFLYYEPALIERPRRFAEIFGRIHEEKENRVLSCTCPGSEKPFLSLASDLPVDNHLMGAGAGAVVFPFYMYDPDSLNRRENITDWALKQFRERYGDEGITKWDIFYYVYAVLHHPAYRIRYAANLRRELPRVPFAPEFRPFAVAGARLADIHVNYEQQNVFPLHESWREASGQIVYNQALTLSGIPHEAERYRLAHKSAVGWVVDQYRVTEDKRSGIVNDPNREGDPKYILRLIGQVVTVSLETVRIVESLPDLGLPEAS